MAHENSDLEVHLPASKSILSRALPLAALKTGTTKLICGALCEDVRAMIGCLRALGVQIDEEQGFLRVHGNGGKFRGQTILDVKNSGTAARFLPPILAFCGGDYVIRLSPQMAKRPMDGLILLQDAGAVIGSMRDARGNVYLHLISDGILNSEFTVDTEKSSQFASGLMLAACAREIPCKIVPNGPLKDSSYLSMTAQLLREFGFSCEQKDGAFEIKNIPSRSENGTEREYFVESDVSAACYFAALSMLLRKKIVLLGVKSDTKQGDFAFLKMLSARGLLLEETKDGLAVDARAVTSFEGFDDDFKDCSDQVLTAAALAPFASSPSLIKNISHIRYQECDRVQAVIENLTKMGVPVKYEAGNLEITPAPIHPCTVQTFGDHRVAMAFSVLARRAAGVEIDDRACVIKTFERFFEELDSIK